MQDRQQDALIAAPGYHHGNNGAQTHPGKHLDRAGIKSPFAICVNRTGTEQQHQGAYQRKMFVFHGFFLSLFLTERAFKCPVPNRGAFIIAGGCPATFHVVSQGPSSRSSAR